jgi:hypothetical protein
LTTPVNKSAPEIVELIRADRLNGLSATDIALKNHVSKTTVLRYCKDIHVKLKSKFIKSAEVIELIRSEYKSGKSIRYLSSKYHTGKPKISEYCKGIIKDSKPLAKSKNGVHKKVPCPICGNPMIKQSGCCYQCYLKTKRKPTKKVEQKKKVSAKVKITNKLIVEHLKKTTVKAQPPEPKTKKQNIIICEKNPNKLGHHWILDKDNFGVCKYCGVQKQHGVITEVTPRK